MTLTLVKKNFLIMLRSISAPLECDLHDKSFGVDPFFKFNLQHTEHILSLKSSKIYLFLPVK